MSFYKKYELDRLMADGEAKSFRAVESATGRLVFLHMFNPSGQPLLAALKSKLAGVKGKPLAPLIEIGEFAGAPYAVTEAIEPFGNLRDWIAANVTASNPLLKEDSSPSLAAPTEVPVTKPPAPVPPSGLLPDGPGEFTRRFETPRDHSPLLPPPVRQGPEVPGEFTRLFETPQDHPPLLPPPVRPAPSAGGLVADDAGEFTRFFQPSAKAPQRPLPPLVGPPAAPPESARAPLWPPPSPHSSDATGQFTRLFGSRLGGEAIDIEKEHASAARSAPPENKPFQAAGEFTRMFGPQGEPGAPVPPRDAPPPSLNTSSRLSSASGMFGSPEVMAKTSHEVLSGGKPPDSAPGEYTRLFDNPGKPDDPLQPASPATPRPQALPARNSKRDMIVIAVSLLTLVLLIVLAIVLLKH